VEERQRRTAAVAETADIFEHIEKDV